MPGEIPIQSRKRSLGVKKYELISFDTPQALAESAAGDWLDCIKAAHEGGHSHCVALSGGRIARPFFAASVEKAKGQKIPLNHVHFFWADERCVPPQDPESNFALAQECLFRPLQIPTRQVHRIRGEIDPQNAAKEAEAEIWRIVSLPAAGQPMLDLIILGMGEDGHVASLFPEMQKEQLALNGVCQALTASPKPPPHRVTLSYATIAAAGEVWVLVSGAGKAAALGDSLTPGGKTPLGRVLEMRESTRIYCDLPLGSHTP